MSGSKKIARIPINGSYLLEVDTQQWTVIRIGVAGERSKKPGEYTETALSFHHNLPQAIQGIIADKTRRDDIDMSSLPAYLSWYESTSHSIVDRILNYKNKELLKEAYELNGVI